MMKAIIVGFILVVAFSTSQAVPFETEWEQFKFANAKYYSYSSRGEHDTRQRIFEENVKRIEKHNAEAAMGLHTYTLEINHMADLTHEEYLQQYTSSMVKTNQTDSNLNVPLGAPESIDWRDEGYVTPVKDQGSCGSCWAFSVTGAIEGAYFRTFGQLVSLSEQDLMDCDVYTGSGCDGGHPLLTLEYVISSGGIDTEASYPYRGVLSQCRHDQGEIGATLMDAGPLPDDSEETLKRVVGNLGPVSVTIDASQDSFAFYKSGVYLDDNCSKYNHNHAVLVVGYGTSDDGQDYWIVKNSWGTKWGDQGYIKMARNRDGMCGITSMAYYAIA